MEEYTGQHKGIDLGIEENAGDQVKNQNEQSGTGQEKIHKVGTQFY